MGIRLAGAARKGCLGVVLLFACSLLAGLGVLIYGWVSAGNEAARFEPMASDLQQACGACFAEPVEPPSRVVRHGRVLIVSADTGRPVALTISFLDGDIRARTPEELSTVVCVTPPEKKVVGTYTDGTKAFREYRDACALTWPDRAPLFALHLVGPEPPAAKSSASGDQSGGDPVTFPLISYLEEAPEE